MCLLEDGLFCCIIIQYVSTRGHRLLRDVVIERASVEGPRQHVLVGPLLFAALQFELVIKLVLTRNLWTSHCSQLWRSHVAHFSPDEGMRVLLRMKGLADLRGLDAELWDDDLLTVVILSVEDLCSFDATLSDDVHVHGTSTAGRSYNFLGVDVGDVGVVELLLDRDDPLFWPCVLALYDGLGDGDQHLLRDLV